jgi:signal transduction histidine kinase
MLIFLAALLPLLAFDEEDHIGADVAVTHLSNDIQLRGNVLAIREGADITGLAGRSPRLWFVVEGGGRSLRHGDVPAEVAASMRLLRGRLKMSELSGVGASGVLGEASMDLVETAAGRMTIAAGGVDPDAVRFADWLLLMNRYGVVPAALLTSVLTLFGGLVAIPLVLRSVRPTVRAAAALDGSDLQQRLPEERVVKELLPIVQAFNSALSRVAESFERRKRFIADVAHELRTPLAILNMHVELLPDGGRKSDLQRTVYRLGQMVGQMLDAERLVLAGRQREPVDLVALARGAIADIAPLAVVNGYELAFFAEQDKVVVDGDPHALSRAIANLLGNALAHGGGSGRVDVRVHADGRLDVSDQGAGVPVEARERIFEPFHRERWDRDGCGLGLHLVREIMHAHGGQARLLSSGPGAVFRLEFPATQPG